jgi:ornithine--oxo-acid transaminase
VLGEYFKSKLSSINNKIIKDVRGKGLWIGMELNESEVNAKDLCLMLLNEGLLCKETHKTVIRFAPPLMISKEDLDWAIEKITKVMQAI